MAKRDKKKCKCGLPLHHFGDCQKKASGIEVVLTQRPEPTKRQRRKLRRDQSMQEAD